MIFAAGLRQNLTELFGGMSIISFMLTTVGLMLVIVEFFQPSYRFPTYCGALTIAGGVVVRMLSGGTFIMLFYMVLIIAVVILGAHMLMLATQKKPWLTQSLALKLENALPEDTDDYSFLLGRDGVATTDIDGNGHMAIDDVHFFVTSGVFIAKGTNVRVVRVAGDRIDVSAVYDDE